MLTFATLVSLRKIYFGGSFFPPHIGHTQIIQSALQFDKEAELYLVPTKQNPLKASPGSNFELIEAWLNDLAETLSYQQYTRLVLEPIEMNSSEEKSYTVDTLSALSNPHDSWVLLVGSDSAENLNKWKDCW